MIQVCMVISPLSIRIDPVSCEIPNSLGTRPSEMAKGDGHGLKVTLPAKVETAASNTGIGLAPAAAAKSPWRPTFSPPGP
jgi:hypothetical protein